MNTILYSVRLSRRTTRGTVEELAAVRVSLGPNATPAAVEAAAVRQAARQGVPVHIVTERASFRLRAIAPNGAEVWQPLGRSGSNDAGFDAHE